MDTLLLYSLAGLMVFALGFYSLVVRAHLLQKILAVNIMSTGVFLILIATAYRPEPAGIDPVPHAMVLTGIVVSICTTAFALVLACRMQETANVFIRDRLDSTSREESAE